MYSSCFPESRFGSPLPSTATASNSSKEGAINRSLRWYFDLGRPKEPSDEICDAASDSFWDTGLGRTVIKDLLVSGNGLGV